MSLIMQTVYDVLEVAKAHDARNHPRNQSISERRWLA